MEPEQEQKMKQDVFAFTKRVNEIKAEKEALDEEYKRLREKIVGLMGELGTKYLRNDNFEVKYTTPHSFDLGNFKYSYPEIAERFIITETITTTKDKIDDQAKELLKEKHPDIWDECYVELTPRLTIKAF
jgi:alkylhydroperoxidase/carboxymuconolactone decarboxylase family protein YurZ